MNQLSIQAKLQENLPNLTDEQLNNDFDKFNNEFSVLEATFSGEPKEALMRLYQSGQYTLDYQHAKFFRNVFDKLKATETATLSLVEFRSVQQLIMSSKFTNPVEASIIDDGLEAAKPFNEKLYELESAIQLYAFEIERRKTEQSTGLEFTEEDNENVKNLEVRPSAIIEAGKDEEEKVLVEDDDAKA